MDILCLNPDCIDARRRIESLQQRIDALTEMLQKTQKTEMPTTYMESSSVQTSSASSTTVCLEDMKKLAFKDESLQQSNPNVKDEDVQQFMELYFGALFDTTTDVPQSIHNKFQYMCQDKNGRLACARALNNRRGVRMVCDDDLFLRLVACMTYVLNLCGEHMDYSPAKTLMNMAFTFYRYNPRPDQKHSSVASKEYISMRLRNLNIWQSLVFWETAFFQAVEHAQSHSYEDLYSSSQASLVCAGEDDAIPDMDIKFAIEEQQRCDVNTMFAQLGSFIQNMVELGVKRQICHDFLEKMGVFSGLEQEQLDSLHDCLADAVQSDQRAVILRKDKQLGYGLILKRRQYEAADCNSVFYIRVSSIYPNSPAALCGEIHPGDRLVGINDVHLTSQTTTEEVRSILSTMDTAQFLLESALSGCY